MATFPLWKKADSRGAGKGRDGWGAGKGATAGEREKARRLGCGKPRDGWGAGNASTFSSLMVSDERSMSIWRSRMRLSTSAGVRERP